MTYDTDWKPPEFDEHKTEGFPFLGRSGKQFLDNDMTCICNELNLRVARLLNEGAKTFTFQWVNVIDREQNPDGVLGTFVIKATR